jgi:uncharacterized membrane protein YebE (DUF533 family)
VRHGNIAPVTSRPTEAQHLQDLARLRRVRDRIDREYEQPLDVETLARGVNSRTACATSPSAIPRAT